SSGAEGSVDCDGAGARGYVVAIGDWMDNWRKAASIGFPAIPKDFALRFALSEIASLDSRYFYKNEDVVVKVVEPRSKEQGFLTGDDFLTLCRWKAPRAERYYVQNLDGDIRAVPKLGLSLKVERLKISLR